MSASLRTLKRRQSKTRDCKLSSLSIELKGILKKNPDGLNISYSHRYLSQISVFQLFQKSLFYVLYVYIFFISLIQENMSLTNQITVIRGGQFLLVTKTVMAMLSSL